MDHGIPLHSHHAYRDRGGFWHWLVTIRLSRLICLLLLILVTAPLIAHHYLAKLINESDPGGHISRKTLENADDISLMKYGELKKRIEELKNIKKSVNNELRDLESRRQKLHSEITGYNTHIEQLKNEYGRTHQEYEQLKLSIENTKVEQDELMQRNMPHIQAPRRILPSLDDSKDIPHPQNYHKCTMYNCFDYSRCSLTSHFPVYLYSTENNLFHLDPFIKSSVNYALNSSPHMTFDPHIACLYVVLVGDLDRGQGNLNGTLMESKLKKLPYWHGDGRNHILVNLARNTGNKISFNGVNIGRAMIADSTFTEIFRVGFDLVLSPSLGRSRGDVWDQLHKLSPARRKHLLSFWGEYSSFKLPASHNKNVPLKDAQRTLLEYNQEASHAFVQYGNELVELISHDNAIVRTLKAMQMSHASDNFLFDFSCLGQKMDSLIGEWTICDSESRREELLKYSTFSLIIAPTNYTVSSTTSIQIRLYESLKNGAIPVIIGDFIHLPFSDMIVWKRAVLTLPKARITELHYYIRSFSDSDILSLRYHGRIIWETYMGTSKSIIKTLLASIRVRLKIPAFPAQEEPSPSVFNKSFIPLKEEVVETQPEADGDILGPIEPPQASPRFLRNFSITWESLHIPGDPFHLYPQTPFENPMPAEAKYIGSTYGYRPIGKGEGGAGKEFNQALGGNVPKEQFTIVMLTFEREAVLVNALQRLKGLPHLNKVVVVWNSPQPPSPELRWPEIGIRVHVIRTSKNSLNNRFLPYDCIETEAVLSIDDDAHLRHDEIIFGFRVWREARDRIVGFPGRFHAWDTRNPGWLYNSNYTCELSMVLTGAAFFHKYYAFLYSYVMPQAIRDKVDEYMNCEDLAMNFLVSHITRKPPLKVTSRWTFRCPGCPNALSVEDSHFQERHRCINFFVQVYGYMPLLNTQFRADSVLFKTRIPHDKQKCFKFI